MVGIPQAIHILTLKTVQLNNINFHPLEVVTPYRDPQLQVGEHYSYLFNLRPTICKSGMSEFTFRSQ